MNNLLTDASDHSLLVRLRGGQQDAATQLYMRYAERLRALVHSRASKPLTQRLEPDDIIQSVFRRFFDHVVHGDYDVPPGEELWGLLLVIALNKIRSEESFHRAARRDMRLESGSLDTRAFDAHARAEGSFLEFCVEDVLGKLPQGHRDLVELRIQGHDVAEVATQTGRSRRTVERILQDARERLRRLLADAG